MWSLSWMGAELIRTDYWGWATGVALFLPVSVLAFAAAITRYHVGCRAVLVTVVAGVVLHAVLAGSLLAYIRGSVSLEVLIVVLGSGRRSVRRFATYRPTSLSMPLAVTRRVSRQSAGITPRLFGNPRS